ncbi:MAG: hypothetical protein JSR30_00305 [Proteobacteria bacterium]|nr:hypothetical protein [Pseudomonadota bacterium]
MTRYQPCHKTGLSGPVFDSHIGASLWIISQPEVSDWHVELIKREPLLIEIQSALSSEGAKP